ncbi:helix-turn-helix transcriptional regulator [Streptomyces iranensis]|uniref:Helix-turn-helix domain protein n=1 Tax=Streptomyces iranensis TaxID=576784 RepID=A0A060ZNL4_9ACTN|nr:helix-turn-helix transcriptional regulator [Streptomyces iranensis]MBP2062333.1 transcriptional regulator with XRE-family HTH domain [Streptomyces iranensis]CDR07466.1 helix-turn-helix domain protein [Streptomyces iranensis]
MHRNNLLGAYLRACRERVSPGTVGLEGLGPRRVAGLRREEVALLAGISSNYYLRLEQGRDRHPSAQVLESLARALRLDPTETAHLLALGRPRTREVDNARLVTVPASIGQLLQTLDLPAFVQDEHFDVLASNALARALSPELRPGRNRLLSVFLDPDERALFADWDLVADHLVASFRASLAADAGDQRTTELVDELSARDTRFHQLWERYAVANLVDRPPVRFAHPLVGEFTLTRDNLAIDGPDALRLMIYHAVPGSDDLRKLVRLRDTARSS